MCLYIYFYATFGIKFDGIKKVRQLIKLNRPVSL